MMLRMRKTYKMRIAYRHFESVKAILQTLNIQIKDVIGGGMPYDVTGIVFKANEKELNELMTKLDKYNIAKAYIA